MTMINLIYTPARNGLENLRRKSQQIVTADQLSFYIQNLAKQANQLDVSIAAIWKLLGGSLPEQYTQDGMPYDFDFGALGLNSIAIATASLQKQTLHYEETTAPTNTYIIPIDLNFNKDRDSLVVFRNSTLLIEEVDYNIGETYLDGHLRYVIVFLQDPLDIGDHLDLIRFYNDYTSGNIIDYFVTVEEYNNLKTKYNTLIQELRNKGILLNLELQV